MTNKKEKNKIFKLALTAMLCALGVVLMMTVHIPLIPGFSFLEYDMGDVPAAFALILMGTPAGIAVLLFVAAVQSLTVSAASSWEGFVMHFFATGAYLTIIRLFIRKKDTAARLISGCIAGTAAMTALMVPLNLIFTPMYLGCTVQEVTDIIIPAILPFNLVKGILNSVMVILIWPMLKKILIKRF